MNPDLNTQEQTVIEAGHTQLSGPEMAQIIVGKTVWGDYGAAFKFVSVIREDGSMEGTNNFGSHNLGRFSIGDDNTFSVQWNAGWDTTTTRAYAVDGQVKFFDCDTGQWRNTFTRIVDGIQMPLGVPASE